MPLQAQLSLAAILLSGTLALTETSAHAETVVKSELYGFSIRFPAEVEQNELGPAGWEYAKALVSGMRRGRAKLMSSWSGQDGQRSFDLVAIQLSDFAPPRPIEQLCAKFNRRVPAMLASPNNRPPRIVDQPMTSASCRVVTLAKSKAMETRLKIEETGLTIVRSTLVGHTFYQLTYQLPPANYLPQGENPAAGEGDRFFDSFTLLR